MQQTAYRASGDGFAEAKRTRQVEAVASTAERPNPVRPYLSRTFRLLPVNRVTPSNVSYLAETSPPLLLHTTCGRSYPDDPASVVGNGALACRTGGGGLGPTSPGKKTPSSTSVTRCPRAPCTGHGKRSP